MKKTLRMTACFVVLFFTITIFSGCGLVRTVVVEALSEATADQAQEPVSSFSPQPFPTLNPQDVSAVPFDEIEYTRPDAQACAARLNEIAGEVGACTDAEALKALFEEGESLYENYLTMATLASLHSSMDLTDEMWAEEEYVTSQGFTAVDMAYEEYYLALYASPFAEEIEENWEPGYFDDVSEEETWYTEATKPLYEKEAALISEYTQQRSTASVLWNGQELTYDEIAEIEDFEEYYEALSAWQEACAPALEEIYTELVKTRMQIAEELGFESYTEMMFAQNNADYTPEMMQEMIDGIVEYLAPVYAEVYYYPDEVQAEYEPWADFVQSTLYELNEAYGENFQLMREYGLIDWEARDGKESGAYTTYLTSYSSPFVLLSYFGDEYSRSTLVHEFGHFNDYLIMGDIEETTDTAEIYSQALELLVANHYDTYFGQEEGYALLYNALADKLGSLVSQVYYTALELKVYALEPEAVTPQAVEEIAAAQAERFGFDDLFGDSYRYDWVCVPHIYEVPFYTFSYATSADIAVQVWEISLTDEQAAAEVYESLLLREKSTEFLANVEAAGLSSPFEEAEIRRMAELFETLLVEEDWSAAAA